MVKDYKIIIGSQKKGILNDAFRQGKIFKSSKDSERFAEMVKELGVSKSTIYFKLILLKILEKIQS